MTSSTSIATTIGCIILLAILVGGRISQSNWFFIEQSQEDIHIVIQRETQNQTKEMEFDPVIVIDERQYNQSRVKTTSSIKSHVDSHPIDELQTNQPHNITTSAGVGVKFIPYPHKTLGSGKDMQCQWETKFVSNPSVYDFIQLSAFEEGICIPIHPNGTIHIFTSVEAKKCLSYKRVIISGDSYMKQLFVGLADILLGKKLQNDEQITDSALRKRIVETANYWLAKRRKKDATFPTVIYSCEQPCYGKDNSFSKKCSKCINSYTLEDQNTVAAVGAGVHIMARKDVNATARVVDEFLNLTKRTIFVSMPSYQLQKVPEQYREVSSTRNNLYDAMIPNLAPRNPDHPFLDVFQLTRSCTMNNCSYDGGHRSRYVNRWKAQLLLNTLCKVAE